MARSAGEVLLPVPLKLQGPKSVDCGPVSLGMVLAYWKLPQPIHQLRKGLDVHAADVGSYLYDNARIAMRLGLNSRVITANPLLFPAGTISAHPTKQRLMKYLTVRSKALSKYETGISLTKKYVRKGGQLTIEIPTEQHIRAALDNGCPVIAIMYARGLGRHEGGHHFVVINGYRKGQFHITNPLPQSTKRAWWPVQKVLFAIYAGATFDIDNGSLLILDNK